MPIERHKPEEIVAKLHQVDVLASQGHANGYTPRPTWAQSRVPIDLIWCGMARISSPRRNQRFCAGEIPLELGFRAVGMICAPASPAEIS